MATAIPIKATKSPMRLNARVVSTELELSLERGLLDGSIVTGMIGVESVYGGMMAFDEQEIMEGLNSKFGSKFPSL